LIKLTASQLCTLIPLIAIYQNNLSDSATYCLKGNQL